MFESLVGISWRREGMIPGAFAVRVNALPLGNLGGQFVCTVKCFRNYLSLFCTMEIAHFSVFHGQKHDFFGISPYCFNI